MQIHKTNGGNMSIYNETKFIMQKYDVHPNKNLGQNFLFDEVALQTIIKDLTSEDIVLEIGPGLGTLTQMMAEKAKKVIAVEIDRNMVEILEDRFKLYENVEIINEDVLK
jgi:16S rRNA (adenine1518-N6/adenine1519-N6)-dimethyltransferase